MPEVRLLGTALRDAIGAKSLCQEGRTLRELLGALSRRGGPELAGRLYADPNAPEPAANPDLRLLVNADLRLLVNGRNANFLDGLDTALRDDDVVTVHFAGARAFPGG